MEWQQILGFYNIVNLGSMTRAAKSTFRTQSALSQQIARLEQELNCKLFERIGKKRFTLTSAGEAFYQFTENVLFQEKNMRDKVKELCGKNAGSISLAAPFGILYFLLPEPIQKYKEICPKVDLHIIQRRPQECLDLLMQGVVDFCIVHGSTLPHSIHCQPWRTGTYMLVVPKGHELTSLHPVTLEDIVKYPLNLPDKNVKFSARDKIESKFNELGLKFTISTETPNIMLNIKYTLMGIGISFILCYLDKLAEEYAEKADFISMEHVFPNETVVVVGRQNTYLPEFKKEFLNIFFPASPEVVPLQAACPGGHDSRTAS